QAGMRYYRTVRPEPRWPAVFTFGDLDAPHQQRSESRCRPGLPVSRPGEYDGRVAGPEFVLPVQALEELAHLLGDLSSAVLVEIAGNETLGTSEAGVAAT